MYICNLYIPPHGSNVLNTQEIDIYELLEQDVLRFKDRGKLYITGDFNGRTASETDVLNFDRYLDDETLFGFIDKTLLYNTTRVNKDNVIDSYGRRLLSFCKITDLIIANGRLGEDTNLGQYTCTFVSHNGLSVVDYLLCSFADAHCIKNFRILCCNEFSDHSPVYFTLPKVSSSRDTLHGSKDQTFSVSRRAGILFLETNYLPMQVYWIS